MSKQAITDKRMQELAAEPSLYRAWDVVGRHGNASGIDHVTVEDFSRRRNQEIPRLHDELLHERYQPQPLITFPKMKKDHTFRELTIASVRDRVAARAAADYLNFHYDSAMVPNSYAYRPHRGALKAVSAAQKACRTANYAARVDIDDFFDSIHHDLLNDKLAELNVAEDVRGLLLKFVGNKRFDGVRMTHPKVGIPQGSPVAPILANLFLDELDRAVIDEGYAYLRYADDLLVFAETVEQAGNAMSLISYTLGQMGLKPDVDKSRVYSLDQGFLFLGFMFNRQGHVASSGAKTRLKNKLGQQAYVDESDEDFQKRQNSIIRGWKNYFDHEEKQTPPDADCVADAIDVPAEETADEAVVDVPSEKPLQDALERAESFAAQGRWATAQQALRRVLNDDAVELAPEQQSVVFTRLADLYDQAGMRGAAARCRGEKMAAEVEDDALVYGVHDVECWLELFGMPEMTVYKQYIDRTGRNGYRPASSPFNAKVLRDHWKGRHTLAVPVYDKNNHVRFGVVDLDVSRAVVDGCNAAELEACRVRLLDDARGLLQLAEKVGVHGLIEDSGYKGYHVWFFCHARLSAELVLRFLQELVRVAGDAPEGCHRELFPGSKARPADALHSRIKVPLGVHRVSGRRSVFVGADGHPFDHGTSLLALNNRNKAAALRGAVERWAHYVQDHTEAHANQAGVTEKQNEGTAPVAGTSGAYTGGVELLFEKCAVLGYLRQKAIESSQLNHAERCILRGVLEPMGAEGVEALHTILKHCKNYNRHQTDAFLSRGVLKPMGCRRIREILGAVADEIGCTCHFKPRKQDYAHPLRHLKTNAGNTPSKSSAGRKRTVSNAPARVATSSKRQDDVAENSSDIQGLLREYTSTRRRLIELQEQIKSAMNGADKLDTEMGTLRAEGSDPVLQGWRIEL